MANIIQIQDDLKKVTDQDLVNFVKNPTGSVPSYLALSEIKRRKESREKYAANKDKVKTTVAQDLTTVPKTMGLSSLAPQSMPQPNTGVGTPQPQQQINPAMLASKGVGQLNPGAIRKMANGGIVGFETGDLVQNVQKENVRKRYSPTELGFSDGPVSFPLGTAISDATSYLNPFSYMDTYNPRVDPVSGRVVSGVGDRFADTKAEILAREIQKRDDIASSDAEKTIAQKDLEVSKPLIEDDYTVSSRQRITENVPTLLASDSVTDTETETETETDNVVDSVFTDDEFKVAGGTNLDIADDTKVEKDFDVADIVAPVIDDKTEISKYLDDKDLKVPTIKEALDELTETRTAAGLAKDPFAMERQGLKSDREKLDKDRSDAASMAFIEAGLLWANKGNIGDAAPAVRNYQKELKGLRGEDRELKKMDLSLKAADVAMKNDNVKSAIKIVDGAEKRMDMFNIAKLNQDQALKLKQMESEIKIMTANLSKDTTLQATRITAAKDPAKVALFKELSKSKVYQMEDGSVDVEKIMKAISPPSSMYAAVSKPAQYMQEYREYIKVLDSLPGFEDKLKEFMDKFPDPASYVRANMPGSTGTATYTTKGGYKPAGS